MPTRTLANFVFDHRPKDAIRITSGVQDRRAIACESFDGVLRGGGSTTGRSCVACMGSVCVSGVSGGSKTPERVFDRMLWLNPSDNQGVRFLIDQVRAKDTWENCR